jgi:UDP-GlcNAc:undecaprenyl-phosphate GlcNAc-1-phosphate transferase
VAGGLAILLSFCISLPLALLYPEPLWTEVVESRWYLCGLLIAVVWICGVGVLDDLGLLRGRHKLFGQLVAIAIVMGFGVMVRSVRVFQWEIDLGLLAIPFTAFLLLGAINSLNLLDGMDGLLATVALIIVFALAAMAVLGEHWSAALVAVSLAGALAGFLRYNFPPASIFLGDSGSMQIGLVVGVLAIQSALKAPATAALAAPLAALTIPILDTAAAILRRKLTGRSIYTTDRGHLHHCLLARGLSPRGVLFWVALFCFFTATGALISLALQNELLAMVTALVVVAILVGVRIFGYGEFLLARARLFAAANSLLRLRRSGRAHASEVRLQGSAGWRVAWSKFVDSAAELNLKSICLDVNAPSIHEGYHARWDNPGAESENPNLWFAEIPLVARGHVVGRVEIAGYRDEQAVWHKLAHLTEGTQLVESTLTWLLDIRTSPAHDGSAEPSHSASEHEHTWVRLAEPTAP